MRDMRSRPPAETTPASPISKPFGPMTPTRDPRHSGPARPALGSDHRNDAMSQTPSQTEPEMTTFKTRLMSLMIAAVIAVPVLLTVSHQAAQIVA